ncbi:L-asparaginase II [Aquimixticola soesokkakensis]|uniref:L-asparaginase II n=1 Tax=Aquimixticola soesokkakensis TaxID=1519096 RepID=A0A1Y5RDX3_9RHOB|nr:asparaginase [Aquimixticola soesokkakensis]SLN14810.1 L-asparaginase II [Aquimixticola soesokkakensis]
MAQPETLVEIWRGPFAESLHAGHAVVCDASGILASWGDPDTVILPRSSVKMIQALPFISSGAADAIGASEADVAFSCASHQGAAIHTRRAAAWLETLGYSEADLICGPQMPDDRAAKTALIKSDDSPCRLHNNCSGKHAGFLSYVKHTGASLDYVEPDHPLQRDILEAFETVTGVTSPGFGVDGCSAPNFATTIAGLGRAMAFYANAREDGPGYEAAAHRLARAMPAFPELVAGEGRACTELMMAGKGKVAIKTGAEGLFTAIWPQKGIGVGLKITDGGTRAAECAIATILVGIGALDGEHPAVRKRMNPRIANFAGIDTGEIKAAPALAGFTLA